MENFPAIVVNKDKKVLIAFDHESCLFVRLLFTATWELNNDGMFGILGNFCPW